MNGQIKETRKNLSLILIIILLLMTVIGGTFAYYAFSANNGSILTGNMGDVKLNLTVTKILPNTNEVDNILVTNFNELADSLNDSCTDIDGEFAMCQLYKVNLSNDATGINTNVKGSISFENETVPNLSWISLGTEYSSNTSYTSTMLGESFNTASSTFTNFVDNYLLNAGSNIDFYILVWVNESEEEQNDEGMYSGTVRFEDANGNGVTATFNS